MIDKYKGECVAVIPRIALGESELFQGFSTDPEMIAKVLDPKLLQSKLRYQMEEDPSYKQLIPYVVHWRGTYRGPGTEPVVDFLSYVRGGGGGESRLHGKISYGIGGHINPGDEGYEAALAREMREEIALTQTVFTPIAAGEYLAPKNYPVIGLVNDDRTLVGQVHIGVVHLVHLPYNVSAKSRELDALRDLQFRSSKEISEHEMETWTELTLQSITDIARKTIVEVCTADTANKAAE